MILSKVVEHLESIAPIESALEDDIVGLIIGNLGKEIRGIGVSWALTPYVLSEAGIKEKKIMGEEDAKIKRKKEEKIDLFVVHEYPFFERQNTSLLALFEDIANFKRIKPIVREDISLYVMHSNLDETEGGTADIIAKSIGMKVTEKIKCGRIGEIPEMNFENLVSSFKTVFVADALRSAGRLPGNKIKRVGIYVGKGLGNIETIEKFYLKNCDVFVSYGLTKEAAQYANEIGMQLLELDPTKVERSVMQNLAEKLQIDLRDVTTIYYDCEDIISYV